MSLRKAVRKRSNWYIYMLTFLITFTILSFVVYHIWDLLFPTGGSQAMGGSRDYRPDASYNSTALFMLSESRGGIPDYYMLINYRPRDEAIVIVPLRESLFVTLASERGTLTDFYRSRGSEGVNRAVTSLLDIDIDFYIKFDKDSFIGFFDLVGFTPVNIPFALYEGEEIKFFPGSYEFRGADLYDYITFPDYDQGEDYRYMLHGLCISNFINRNSRNLSVTQLQGMFNRILNTTDTNLEFADFTRNQVAYLYTTQNSREIADYYIPSGSTDQFGQFIISDTAIETIWSRFAIEREEE
ncbi:MAG: LCP family protein [Oscillospiraceae bacterium]|nr:LCP family protein [Oscillospiraceae bacterium]